DLDIVLTIGGAAHRVEEAGSGSGRHFEQSLVGGDANRADLAAAHMSAPTQQRQEPAWLGILIAADIDAEPRTPLEAGPRTASLRGRIIAQQFFRLGLARAMGMDERGGDLLGAALRQKLLSQRMILLAELDRREQKLKQARAV